MAERERQSRRERPSYPGGSPGGGGTAKCVVFVDAVSNQNLAGDNPAFDFGNVVREVFFNGRVKDACVIWSHARPKEVKKPQSIPDLVFMSCHKVGVVLCLPLFFSDLP
jgi:hypothetical protein